MFAKDALKKLPNSTNGATDSERGATYMTEEWVNLGDGILIEVSEFGVQIIRLHDDGTYSKMILGPEHIEKIFSLFRKKQLKGPRT